MYSIAYPKVIKIKPYQMICFLLLLMLYPKVIKASAFTPTLTPTSVSSATLRASSIMESFDVQLFNDGTWSLLEKEMIATHENHCYYDGVLMFVPLSDFVEQTQMPRIRLSKDFNYHVIALDPNVSLEYSHTIYSQEWEEILHGKTHTPDWNKLDSGKYLMSINVFATDGDRYANTVSLFWLIVGDYEDPEEYKPLFTPTASPAPTLAPTASEISRLNFFDLLEMLPKKEPATFVFDLLDDGTYSLVEYNGTDAHVEVPAYYQDRTVTEIGRYAFVFNECITSVTIPNTVRIIGESAFCGCSNLTGVIFSEEILKIGPDAFCNCSALQSITLPNKIQTIERGTFMFCDKLNKVILPDSIMSIDEEAFSMCSSLEYLELPAELRNVGSRAFAFDSLKKVILPASIQLIGEDAFSAFSSLLVYPDSYAAEYAEKNLLSYNLLGEDLNEKYSWLPATEQIDPSKNQLRVKVIDDRKAYIAVYDPKLKNTYAVNYLSEPIYECLWSVEFADTSSGERIKVHLDYAKNEWNSPAYVSPEEMNTAMYFYENENLWDFVRDLPMQKHGQWLIWNVVVPEKPFFNSERQLEFSFKNVDQYNVTISIVDEKRYEQYAFFADEIII